MGVWGLVCGAWFVNVELKNMVRWLVYGVERVVQVKRVATIRLL